MPAQLDHPRDAARFFDGFATTFDTLYDGQRGPLMRWLDQRYRSDIEIRYRLTFERLGDLTGCTVLDIGCGSGPYLVAALRQGAARVTGVDPAPGMLRIAAERLEAAGLRGRCRLVESPFPGAPVARHDYAIVMGVMDYVRDAPAFLSALRSRIRRGAALSFPSIHWFRTPFRRFRYRLRHCPLYFRDRDTVARLCRDAGFGDVAVHAIPGAGQDYHVWARV